MSEADVDHEAFVMNYASCNIKGNRVILMRIFVDLEEVKIDTQLSKSGRYIA